MKKKLVAILSLILVFSAFFLVGCNEGNEESETSSVYEFKGIKECRLSVSDAQYDFSVGVKGYKDYEETEFTVDASAVAFGTAGEYDVVYSIDGYKEVTKAYVYGAPTFRASGDGEVSYSDAGSEEGLKKAVVATDSFGVVLPVKVVSGIKAGANGYIEFGKHTVKYSAKDIVGNVAEFSYEVIVSDKDKPVFDDVVVDLSDLTEVAQVGKVRIERIIYDGKALSQSDYLFANGYLRFSEQFILSKEVGQYNLVCVTDGGYANLKLTITDERPAVIDYYLDDMEYAGTLCIDKPVYVGHQKDITYEYVLKTQSGTLVGLDEIGDKLYFEPGSEELFTFTIFAKRGAEDAGSKDYKFKVHDDVFVRTVSKNDEYDDFFSLYGCLAENDEELKHGTDLSSTKLSSDTGALLLTLSHNTVHFGVGGKAYCWIYNSTGIALQAYFITDNGYWTEMISNGILTDIVDISAEEGWQKVEFTFVPQFTDGDLGSITYDKEYYEENGGCKTDIRIYNPNGWGWDKAEPFSVNVTNIYYENNNPFGDIEYDESNSISKGIIGMPITVAVPHSDDARVSFDYSVTLSGETAIAFDKKNMTFTPDEDGEYVYKITALYKNTKLSEKYYTINIGGNVSLNAKDYYRYGEDGTIQLPTAFILDAEATAVYTVTDPAGETTTLGESMIYDTDKVDGTYLYKAVVIKDGVEIGEDSVLIAVHADNVVYGFGDGLDITSALSYNGEIFEFDTTERRECEVGSLKGLQTEDKTFLTLRVDADKVAGKVLKLYIKTVSGCTIIAHTYSSNVGVRDTNYWFNGQHYTSWTDACQTNGEWQEIAIVVPDTYSGSDTRIMFEIYGMGDNALYLSNVYDDTVI